MGFVLFVAGGALKDSVAPLDKLACVIVLRGDRLFYLPVVAQGGQGFRFRLLALRASIDGRAGAGADGESAV